MAADGNLAVADVDSSFSGEEKIRLCQILTLIKMTQLQPSFVSYDEHNE